MSFHKIKNKKTIFHKFISWYSMKLQSKPLMTKAITSGVIAGAGDLTCQFIVQQRTFYNDHGGGGGIDTGSDEDGGIMKEVIAVGTDKFQFKPDFIRTGRFTFLGFALIAPVVHVWYGILMNKIPGSSLTVVLQRTFFDQICFAPIFIPTFMTSLMVLESKPIHEIHPVLIKDVPDVVKTNWALWVPAMLINFRYIPGPWQVLFSNCIGFVWNVYLSWKTQED